MSFSDCEGFQSYIRDVWRRRPVKFPVGPVLHLFVRTDACVGSCPILLVPLLRRIHVRLLIRIASYINRGPVFPEL